MTQNQIAERVQRWVTAMPMAQTLDLRFVEIGPGLVVLEMPILSQFASDQVSYRRQRCSR